METRQLSAVIFALLVAGCQGMPSLPTIGAYRMDIQQGNVVTQDMVAKLQPGMTRSQVRYVMGTPLVTDIFHADRWDYIYRLEKAGKLVEHRRIIVVFSEDKLVRIEGDVVPGKPVAKAAPSPSAAAPTAPGTPPPAGATPAPPAPGEAAAAPEKK